MKVAAEVVKYNNMTKEIGYDSYLFCSLKTAFAEKQPFDIIDFKQSTPSFDI